jgi:hypothetical protein
MGRMNDGEWHAFLAEGARVAVLATARREIGPMPFRSGSS